MCVWEEGIVTDITFKVEEQIFWLKKGSQAMPVLPSGTSTYEEG
jgi:hypothetical protein